MTKSDYIRLLSRMQQTVDATADGPLAPGLPPLSDGERIALLRSTLVSISEELTDASSHVAQVFQRN